MALLVTSIATPIVSTMGKLETIVCNIASSELLTGKLLRVNPALYISSATITDPLNVDYQLIYPATGTDLPLDQPTNNNTNWKLTLTVIDGYRFELTYKFFASASSGGYLSDTPSINSNLFSQNALSGNVVLHVNVDDEKTNFINPISVNGFYDDIEISPASNQSNTTLDIEAISNDTAGIDNNFELFWYREDQISSNANVAEDLGVVYAKIDSSPNQVDTDISVACLTQGKGFVNGQASWSVDNSCVIEKGSYRAILIYRKDGELRSARSSILKEGTNKAQSLATITSTIEDELGASTTNMSAKNLSEAVRVSVCVDIDKASYDANVLANGAEGDFDTNLVSAKAYLNTTGAVGGVGSNVQITDSAATYQICLNDFLPPSGYVGAYYLSTELIFDYGDYQDKQVYINELIYSTTSSAEDITQEICAEAGGNLIVPVASGGTGCIVKESINGSAPLFGNVAVAASATDVTINTDELAIGDSVCVYSICSGTTSSNPVSDCECEPCENIRVFVDAEYNGIQWDVTFSTNEGLLTVNNQGGTGTAETITINDSIAQIYAVIIEVNINGCIYVHAENLSLSTSNQSFNEIYEISPLNSNETDCDCNEVNPDCDNFAFFDVDCDTSTQTITITEVDSLSSTSVTDVSQMTLDGVNWIPVAAVIVGESEVTLQRDITFDDKCDDVHVTQTVICKEQLSCQNNSQISWSYASGVLNITKTDTFSSTAISDKLNVSKDGGLTFTEFDMLTTGYTPISVDGGDSIVMQSIIKFSDGCPDIIQTLSGDVNSTTVPATCDYSGYSVSAAYASQTFTATFGGDESALTVNDKFWIINGGDPLTAGNGVPYTNPVSGQGQFILGWRIQLPDCEEETLYAFAFGQPQTSVDSSSGDLGVVINNDCDNPVLTSSCDDDPYAGAGQNVAGK